MTPEGVKNTDIFLARADASSPCCMPLRHMARRLPPDKAILIQYASGRSEGGTPGCKEYRHLPRAGRRQQPVLHATQAHGAI